MLGVKTPFYAQENFTYELDVYEDTSQYDEINAMLEERGREIIENNNSNSRYIRFLLSVTRLVQTDSRWSNVQLGTSGQTIGSAGCCLTSFTMIRNYISGTSDTPVNVNSVLGSNANPFNYSVAASRYGYDIVTAKYENAGISESTAKSIIIGALNEFSKPVLVGVKNSSGATHFVVAAGYNSDLDIIIKDPASRNYVVLSQYLNAGYYVHRIYCFDN